MTVDNQHKNGYKLVAKSLTIFLSLNVLKSSQKKFNYKFNYFVPREIF